MIRRDGARMVISGPATLATAARLLEEGRRHLAEGVATVDLAEVSELDSSLLALALEWLRENKNESALASNRFGETRHAVKFVEQLYASGARLVIVPDESINTDGDTIRGEGGPYADALVVNLPEDEDRRKAVIAICQRELKREGFKLEDGMSSEQIYLWWD